MTFLLLFTGCVMLNAQDSEDWREAHDDLILPPPEETGPGLDTAWDTAETPTPSIRVEGITWNATSTAWSWRAYVSGPEAGWVRLDLHREDGATTWEEAHDLAPSTTGTTTSTVREWSLELVIVGSVAEQEAGATTLYAGADIEGMTWMVTTGDNTGDMDCLVAGDKTSVYGDYECHS